MCDCQDKNVYVEDWGEGLVGKSCPVLCVADLNKGAVIVYAGVPPHISPGQVSQRSLYLIIYIKVHVFLDCNLKNCIHNCFFQALWAPNGRGIVFVGQWNEPFRLGLKFCSNRR